MNTFALNMVLLFATGIYMGVLKKNNKLTAKRFAVMAIAYFSFFVVSTIHSFSKTITTQSSLLDIGFLIFLWEIGYPFARWIYRQ